MDDSCSILITVDVEDWFQVENFKQYIPYSSWPSCELRVEKNTHDLLDLFDSIKLQRPNFPASQLQVEWNPKATFFILGWIAERLPNLIREIHTRGHEIASHGYRHTLCNSQLTESLKIDLRDSKKLLEDIIGGPIYGFRAPSFSITHTALKIIEESGYLYDSSSNSFGLHRRYGRLDLANNKKDGIAVRLSDSFYELPVSNLKLAHKILPWGGGAYFRLIPLCLFKFGTRSILKKKNAYLLYIHPWEIDAGQPRVKKARPFLKFRHYANLDCTLAKLSSFIKSFRNYKFISCLQYLKQIQNFSRI